MSKRRKSAELRVLSFGESSEFEDLWDDFISEHEFSSIGHLRENFALAEIMGVKNRSMILLDENCKVLAVLPLFEKYVKKLRIFRVHKLSSGLEFASGPLVDKSLSKGNSKIALEFILNNVYKIACESNVDFIEISYPAMAGDQTGLETYRFCPLRLYNYTENNRVGWIIDLRNDIEQLNKQLESRCRNAIRAAMKEGCTVRYLRNRQEWLSLRELAIQTLGDAVHSEEVHAAWWDYFIRPGYARGYVITSPHSDNPTSVNVIVGWKKNWYGWKAFNSRKVRIRGAANLAMWEGIVDIKNRGGFYLEIGSLEVDNPKGKSISDWKSSFGGLPTYFLGGIRYCRPVKRSILEILSSAYDAFRG